LRYLAPLALALWLCGCTGSKTPEASAKTEPVAEQKARPTEVVLSPEAQRNGGIAVQPVQSVAVQESLSATGALTVNEDRTWTVGSHLEGRVVSVHANPGEVVKQGFVLARMHSHEVHDSRANYRRAADELTRARAAASQARTLRDRAARLLELKAGSKQDLELAEGQVREGEAAVRNAETELERSRVHILEYLQVSLEEKPGGDEVPIRAPATGLILERKVSVGTVVEPAQEAFRMTDPSTLWMIANVSEGDLGRLKLGQSVRLLVRAHPGRTFAGRILRLGEQLDPTTRTLQVRVLVPNPGGLLKPQMYATAEIQGGGSRQAMYVPESAIQDLNGTRIVFVRSAADRFEARPVDAGRAMDQRVEVRSGLQATDQVVVKGTFVLKSQLMRTALESE
jgi:membrane fusion protein, heavy metal efflux system